MRKLAGFVSTAGLLFTVACGQTDAGITTAVKSKMAADDSVKAYQVNVDTNNHVVTLTGDVNTVVAKERALALARETDGVRDVIDRLSVADTAATSGLIEERHDTEEAAAELKDDIVADGKEAGRAVKRSTERTADATKDATEHGARTTSNSIEHGAEATKHGAEEVGKATADGAKKVGKATADGAKKVGSEIKDVFTDDNHDSNHDGK